MTHFLALCTDQEWHTKLNTQNAYSQLYKVDFTRSVQLVHSMLKCCAQHYQGLVRSRDKAEQLQTPIKRWQVSTIDNIHGSVQYCGMYYTYKCTSVIWRTQCKPGAGCKGVICVHGVDQIIVLSSTQIIIWIQMSYYDLWVLTTAAVQNLFHLQPCSPVDTCIVTMNGIWLYIGMPSLSIVLLFAASRHLYNVSSPSLSRPFTSFSVA